MFITDHRENGVRLSVYIYVSMDHYLALDFFPGASLSTPCRRGRVNTQMSLKMADKFATRPKPKQRPSFEAINPNGTVG